MGRHELWWALGVGGAAIASFFLFRTPEPARTGFELLESVCGAAGARRNLIDRMVSEPLALSLPEGSEAASRSYSHAELDQELTRLDAAWAGCAFSLRDWRLLSQEDGAEWLEGVLEYSDSQPSDLHAQQRRLRALFRSQNGVFRLERLILGPTERRRPEARP